MTTTKHSEFSSEICTKNNLFITIDFVSDDEKYHPTILNRIGNREKNSCNIPD